MGAWGMGASCAKLRRRKLVRRRVGGRYFFRKNSCGKCIRGWPFVISRLTIFDP